MTKTISYQTIKQFISNSTYYISNIKTSLKRPPLLVVELTSKCNLNCIMCGKNNSMRAKEHMDFELFKKIIDDAKKSNIDAFQFSYYGESTLYPKLIEAIKYTKEKIPNSFISMNTNGLTLTPKFSKNLLDTNIDSIVISIEGNNKEEYETIRVGSSWNILRKNIKNLREIIDRGNYHTKLGIMGLNVNDIYIDKELYIKTWGAYSNTLFTRNTKELNKKIKEPFFSKLMPCRKIFGEMVIMTSGDVTRCDYDWEGIVSYGNIKDSTILELWNTPSLYQIRQKHLLGQKRKINFCDICTYRADPFKKSNLL